jgi:preprotein translocase subunit SecE
MNKITAYLDDVGKEMRKVNWPKRSELIDNTVVTLVGTLLISLFIFAADRVISFVLDFIYV